jgi:uncharacterized membrane protein (UPF0182 family)
MGFRPIFGPEDGDLGPLPPQFRFRRRGFRTRLGGGWNRWIALAVFLLLLYIVLNTLKSLYVDWLWFEGAGYRSVYSKILETRLILFFGGALLFLAYFGSNVFLAARLALRQPAVNVSESEAASLRRLYLLAIIAASLFFAIIFGSIAAGRWATVLQFLNSESFGIQDPQFGRDIGFFVFKLPALRFFYGWLMGAAVLTTLAVAGLYLFRYMVVGYDAAAVRQTRVHLSLLLIAVIALFVWHYWLERFELSYSTSGVVFGAGYTDVHARLPFLYVGMAAGVVTAATLLVSAFRTSIVAPAVAMGIWILIAIVGGGIYPATVQRLNVQPNELERERQYIDRNITATRAAFGLDAIDERPFPGQPFVTPAEIAENPETINNIRLLDVDPLQQTYNQIQTIRPLYEFNDVDVDRYVVDGVRRQVMISARELNPSRLPTNAQSWVNRRLQFTHGYGIVMSPVNEVVEEGLPNLFLRDIPIAGRLNVQTPGIYYGEEPEHYVIVNTKAQEFDYPDEERTVQTNFEGEGGVKLSNLLRRIVLAWDFADLNIAISGSITSESRILFRRNIQDRVETLAPFLTLDRDPYIVLVDGNLYWIQDAYTTTGRYPYSTPAAAGYNYIRNSVKVVINAYDGATTLYLVDDTDPIIRTYSRIFPKLFTPLSEMPAGLRDHLRYPEDMFLTQVNHYRTYHIRDAGVLYNREDVWNIPTELTGGAEAQVQPYYVIMRIPGETRPEFVLILPLTPARRQNTIAWVAARSDAPNYGKMLSFRFPTETLVFGPRQVESRIDQDPQISAQFSLWNQSGSNVIRGNLLMIPIGQGNMFVEPIYLQAETSQLPELKRVVVVNGNEIAMEPTLERSLAVVFGNAPPTAPVAEPGTGGQAPGGQTPGATATPSPGPPTLTPTPTSTPPSGGAPLSIGQLAREADAAYQRAQEALRQGDFATYGVEIAEVERLVQQIVQQTNPQ